MLRRTRPKCKLGDWSTAAKRIALVGDSTLDNVLWVGDDPCIAEQLADHIRGAAVANLAADGYTTSDVLYGSERVISVGMRGRAGEAEGCDPLQFEANGNFCPLSQLAALQPPPTHIILSVGGNDVREILTDMGKLPQVVREFMPKYTDIVDVCMTVSPSVVLMFQYRPSFYMDGGGYGVYQAINNVPGPGDAVQKLNNLMQTIYAPVLKMAREKKLPIIDLPRTFDIYCDELYSHQIEPSAQGGEVIVSLVHHVVDQDSPGTPSIMYSYAPCIPGKGSVTEAPNEADTWTIPYSPASPSPARSDGTDCNDAKVMALVGMGFERNKVEAALVRNGGDQGRAVEDLLRDSP
eukprot:TRINITY_DN65042_c0_g1_i1.p1 TRINITY_DN65042_c0_g1~~TRINITY_DN65042_c0_g1_i1.p1  ORF type:complete len:350 (+),score=50.98 TRINITY_DN65042_c0_g1_i1:134-1183(+)